MYLRAPRMNAYSTATRRASVVIKSRTPTAVRRLSVSRSMQTKVSVKGRAQRLARSSVVEVRIEDRYFGNAAYR